MQGAVEQGTVSEHSMQIFGRTHGCMLEHAGGGRDEAHEGDVGRVYSPLRVAGDSTVNALLGSAMNWAGLGLGLGLGSGSGLGLGLGLGLDRDCFAGISHELG